MTDLVTPVSLADLRYFNGFEPAALSAAMVMRQRLSLEEVRAIQQSHRVKRRLFHLMEKAPEADLPGLARLVAAVEFRQQALWRFEPNAARHYWWRVPHCTCPKQVNFEQYHETSFRFIATRCRVHGPMLAADRSDRVSPRAHRLRVPRGCVVVDIQQIAGRMRGEAGAASVSALPRVLRAIRAEKSS